MIQIACDVRRRCFGATILVLVVLTCVGCSLRSMAVNAIVPTLADPTVYLSEEDPELVRESLPFLLKTIESILTSSPEHREALLFACQGFALYANAFLETDASLAEWEDYEIADLLNGRARRMYVRARDYCLRRMELDYPGIAKQLQLDPENAVQVFEHNDVETMYYLGGSWALAISLGLDQPALAADLPAVRALMGRAATLDEDYNRGALQTALITLESLPDYMGGSVDRARQHFARAVELSEGLDAAPYVSLASGVSISGNDRTEFEQLLNEALKIDPDEDINNRLLNTVTQKRARVMLEHIDDLFDMPLGEDEGSGR